MKKKLILGMLLIAGSAIEAAGFGSNDLAYSPVSYQPVDEYDHGQITATQADNDRIPMPYKGSTQAEIPKKHPFGSTPSTSTMAKYAIPAATAAHIAYLEQRIRTAQTKFINKVLPAAYEFAGEYIQAMHGHSNTTTSLHNFCPSHPTVKILPEGTTLKNYTCTCTQNKLQCSYFKRKIFFAPSFSGRNLNEGKNVTTNSITLTDANDFEKIVFINGKLYKGSKAYNSSAKINEAYNKAYEKFQDSAAMKKYKKAYEKFQDSAVAHAFDKAQDEFFKKPVPQRNFQTFNKKPVVEKYYTEREKVRSSSPEAQALEKEQAEFNALPEVKMFYALRAVMEERETEEEASVNR